MHPVPSLLVPALRTCFRFATAVLVTALALPPLAGCQGELEGGSWPAKRHPEGVSRGLDLQPPLKRARCREHHRHAFAVEAPASLPPDGRSRQGLKNVSSAMDAKAFLAALLESMRQSVSLFM